MKNMIINYLHNVNPDTIKNYFINEGIYLSDDEYNHILNFIHNDLELINHLEDFNIDSYQKYFSETNFIKLKNLYHEVLIKYQHYL